MKLLPSIVCWLKGHRLDHAYYLVAMKCEYGFMHYGIVAKCTRCEEVIDQEDDTKLPILEPF